jgi:hypothetical protein
MLVGGAFLAGTSFVLFGDVWAGAPLTGSHVMTGLALLGATAAGHSIVIRFREGRYMLMAGLILLACASLGYVATMSGARNAEHLVVKSDRIKGANALRSDALTRLASERERLEDLRSDARRECRTGLGPKCKGANESASRQEAVVSGLELKTERLGSSETPNAGYRQAAEAISLLRLSSRSVDDLEKVLVVLMPWLAVLIAELGAIVFLSAALGHEVRPVKTVSLPPATRQPVSVSGPAFALVSGAETEKLRNFAGNSNVVRFPGRHPVVAALEAGPVSSNDELAARMNCTKGEASKRWREVEHLLDVQRNGKTLRIALRA